MRTFNKTRVCRKMRIQPCHPVIAERVIKVIGLNVVKCRFNKLFITLKVKPALLRQYMNRHAFGRFALPTQRKHFYRMATFNQLMRCPQHIALHTAEGKVLKNNECKFQC